jgi:hypothetical protein
MSTTAQITRVTPYVSRLIQDQYVQEQLGEVIKELRKSSRRAKGRSAKAAVTDRRLQHQLRDAAGSLTEAVRALKQPEPPKRHPLRRGLALTAALGGGAWAWQQRSAGSTDVAGSS